MVVVTQLLAAVGTLAAVVLLLLMAVVPLLVDLPAQRRKGPLRTRSPADGGGTSGGRRGPGRA
jgi:hypothetical protein